MLVIKDRHRHVQVLENDLDGAIRIVHTIISLKGFESSHKVYCNLQERMEFQSNAGFYPIEDRNLPPPNRVETLRVELDEKANCLVLSWKNDRNATGIVQNYEVEVSNDSDDIKKYVTTESEQAALTNPLLKPGKRYTFKVLAIGKGGASKWSEEKTMYFKTAVPTKPRKPEIIIKDTTTALVLIPQPPEIECNGAQISHYILEYIARDDNSTKWDSLVRPMPAIKSKCHNEDARIKIEVKELVEDRTYDFRVKFRNAVGDSPPSETVTTCTQEPIPGPPCKLRVSSKCTAKSIKIRWSEPSLYPRFAYYYKIEMRHRKQGEWKYVTDSKKLSAEVKGLNQNAKYYFRIKAFNKTGECSNFSEEIKAKTKMHKAAKGTLAPLAFIGGTMAGPFIGGIGGAAFGVSEATDKASSKAGKGFAGVAGGTAGLVGGGILGTLGAPLVGGAFAYQLCHESDWSEQSSDEETTI